MRNAILYAGGIINALLAIFHMLFWKMLNWSEELPRLSKENEAIMHIGNVILITVIAYFSVMSFIMIKRKLDIFGKSIVILISVFYGIRLVLGYPFFGFSIEELVIWVVCLLIIAGYVAVLFLDKKEP